MSRFEAAWCRSTPWRAFAQRVVLPWALQGARLEGEVLEIGGGSGAMAAQVLEAFPGARLTVTDVDDAMVAVARERLGLFGARVDVRQADATALPFEEGRFDAVLSFIMLHHVLAWEQALVEAARVLRPGGRLVGYDLLATGPTRLLHRLEGSRSRLMPIVALREHLATLPLAEIVVTPALGPFAVRFSATRASAES